MNVPFDAINGYDRSKHPGTVKVQNFTLDELKTLKTGTRQWFMCGDGKARQLTITRVKTWKRRPNEVEVHGKYGMYDYLNFGTLLALELLLKEV